MLGGITGVPVDATWQQRAGREGVPSHPAQYPERHPTAQLETKHMSAPFEAPLPHTHTTRCAPPDRSSQWRCSLAQRNIVESEQVRVTMQARWQPGNADADHGAPPSTSQHGAPFNVLTQQCGVTPPRPAAVVPSGSSESLLAMLDGFEHDCDVTNVVDDALPPSVLDPDGALDIGAGDARLQRNVALTLSSGDFMALQVPQAGGMGVAVAAPEDAAATAGASDDDDAVEDDEWRPGLTSDEAGAVSGRKRRKAGDAQASESRQSRRCALVAPLMLLDTLFVPCRTHRCRCCCCCRLSRWHCGAESLTRLVFEV